MLIRAVLGQALGLDEPERYIAGERGSTAQPR